MPALAQSVRVTLDAGGAGIAQLGPGRAGEEWLITRMTTRGDSASEPSLDVRRGTVGGTVVDTTRRGNQAVSETSLPLMAGEYLTIVYTGGTPGAIMTFSVEGEM